MQEPILKSILKNLVRDEQRWPALLQVRQVLEKEWSEIRLLGKSSHETVSLVAENEGRKQAMSQFFQRIERYASND